MSEAVFIFDTFPASPTYHDYGRISRERDVTKCGLVMYDGAVRYRALLRRDHADLFAKPCAKCFRGEAVDGR